MKASAQKNDQDKLCALVMTCMYLFSIIIGAITILFTSRGLEVLCLFSHEQQRSNTCGTHLKLPPYNVSTPNQPSSPNRIAVLKKMSTASVQIRQLLNNQLPPTKGMTELCQCFPVDIL